MAQSAGRNRRHHPGRARGLRHARLPGPLRRRVLRLLPRRGDHPRPPAPRPAGVRLARAGERRPRPPRGAGPGRCLRGHGPDRLPGETDRPPRQRPGTTRAGQRLRDPARLRGRLRDQPHQSPAAADGSRRHRPDGLLDLARRRPHRDPGPARRGLRPRAGGRRHRTDRPRAERPGRGRPDRPLRAVPPLRREGRGDGARKRRRVRRPADARRRARRRGLRARGPHGLRHRQRRRRQNRLHGTERAGTGADDTGRVRRLGAAAAGHRLRPGARHRDTPGRSHRGRRAQPRVRR